MKINKYFTTIIIISTLLILTNCIYATDIENKQNNSNKLEEVAQSDENIEYTTVQTSNELKNALIDATESTNNKHVINLEKNTYKFNKPIGNINSDEEKEITINGNHSIINGNNKISFLKIPNNIKLIMNNITLQNMYGTEGTAINNVGTIILENVIFENNFGENNESSGGVAIYSKGNMSIINCTFKNNTMNQGSIIYIINSNVNYETINIINCTFSGNNIKDGDTIRIIEYSNINIKNTNFFNENKQSSIIKNDDSNIIIENCNFHHNNNTNQIIINMKECLIKNCSFYENNNQNTIINKYNISLIDSKISYNNISNLLNIMNNATINNCRINNNHINRSMIINQVEPDSNEYYLNINNTNIYNNIAKETCGIENIYIKSKSTITNSTWTNNTSLNDKGVISDYYGSMNILCSEFYNNTSNDLFIGNINNYNAVNNNTYKGNYLKSFINTTSKLNDKKLNITGTIKTNDIYNTTISSGTILLTKEDNILAEENVYENKFTILSTIDNKEENKFLLTYNGNTDFKNLSEDIEVEEYIPDYGIEIQNISDNYVYGDFITFEININNMEKDIIDYIQFENIIPDTLIYNSSTYEFDKINNRLILTNLEKNESRTIKFYCTPKVSKNIELKFKIIDSINGKTYETDKNVTFIKPQISIEKIIAHPGEVINITAKIESYNKNNISNITFKFKYKEVNDINTKFDGNTLIIENYKLDDNLVKKDYNIELICSDENLEESFSNISIISIIRYKTFSLIDYNISDNILDLKIKVLNEANENTSGSLVFKINGKTIKTIKVIDGVALLNKYKITKNYYNQYNITILFLGNNMYDMHNNNTIIQEEKKEVNMIINYSIYGNMIKICLNINSNNKIPDSGYIAFKINNKTIDSKKEINESLEITYCLDEIKNLNSISVYYYGNENYLDKTELIVLS